MGAEDLRELSPKCLQGEEPGPLVEVDDEIDVAVWPILPTRGAPKDAYVRRTVARRALEQRTSFPAKPATERGVWKASRALARGLEVEDEAVPGCGDESLEGSSGSRHPGGRRW